MINKNKNGFQRKRECVNLGKIKFLISLMRNYYLFVIFGTCLLLGCKPRKDDTITLSDTSITLNIKEEYQLSAVSEVLPIKFKNSNSFVASVHASTGKVTGVKVGTTIVTAFNESNEIHCKVVVNGLYNLFDEPFRQFLQSEEAVKSFENRRIIYDEADTLIYADSHDYVYYIAYFFNKEKYILCNCFIDELKMPYDSVVAFLKERYKTYYESESLFLGVPSDNSYFAWCVKVQDSDFVAIGYEPYTELRNLKNDPLSSQKFDVFLQNIDAKIKKI